MKNCKKCKYEKFKSFLINEKIHIIKICILCKNQIDSFQKINEKNKNYKQYQIPKNVFDPKLGF
jgi:hypothetical protein